MRRARGGLAGVVVLGLAIATHHEILGYWFTGDDTIPLIETNRIATVQDVVTVLTRPLLHGTRFAAEMATFYRPVASLSYAFDYWIWGLDPFGYHLTDLLLHALVSLFVFGFVREVTDDDLMGLLAGCLFAIHPITAEVVPTPARRHDMLAAIFLLASLVAFLRAWNPSWRIDRRYLGGSLFLYVFALGSKEVAMILPGLLATWVLLTALASNSEFERALRTGTAAVLPYVLITAGYLAVRVSLFGGIGGYRQAPEVTMDALVRVLAEYIVSFVYPVDLLGIVPVSDVAFVSTVLSVSVAVVVGGTAYAAFRNGGLPTVLDSKPGRLIVLSGAWTVAHVPLFLQSPKLYTPRHGYVPLVPFVTIVAVVLVVTARELRRSGSEHDRTVDVGAVGTVAVVGLLILSLAAVSPLVHPYDEWKCAGALSESALQDTADQAGDLPPNAVVAVVGSPIAVDRPTVAAEPEVKTVSYFRSYTVASWLRLRHPGSSIATYSIGPPVAIDGDAEVTANLTRLEDKRFPRLFLGYSSRSPNCDAA